MKKVNFFGMILVIFACLIVPKTGVSAPLHPAGLLWDSAEIIEANLLERSPLAYEQVLPSQVDISHLFPPPGNQGAQNSCVAWAVAYLRTKHEGILRDWDFSSNEKISAHEQILSHEKISAHENISSHEKITSQEKISANENIFADEKISAHEKIPHKNIFAHENISSHEKILSPAYIYNQINGGGDTGSSYSDALNLLIHQGVTTLASFPYNQFDFRAQPNVSQRGEAVDFRIGSWNTIRGVDEMRRFLHEKNGIVVGVNIFPGFDRISRENPVFDTILFGERHRGGHAVVLVGYCDEKQAFKFLNSWGISWGVDGFGWISYELLGDSRVNSRAWGGQPVGYIMNPEDSRTHENFFDFSVENNEATITRYFGPGGELAIPKNIGGYPVTSIGADAIIFRAREGHSPTPSRVEIPDGVVSIGARAFNYGLVWFRETMSLTEILIPESVTTIGSAAFSMSYFPASTAPQGMILPDITIYGAENSFAHEYANANLIPFAAIGNEPTQRSITFHLGGGTRTGGGALRQLVNYGDDAVPPIVSQTGHTFAGWNDDFTNVIDNRVVRALWTATPAFTVTFDPAGGTRTGGGQLTQSIPEGGNAVLPILAPHDEYVFLGWDGDHTNITSNRTITAIWVHVSDTRTVTFELAGGTRTGGGALFQRIAYGRDAVPPQVSRAHHAFDGWDGDYTNVTTDRTITALWTALPT
ncbi:MAG: InlB B-repeat-containing protein, partial [Defluviitaleaceae bacterium]|nr:InlB B-repeat-containing protein [Defluviitaleaceae bacterium]